MPEQLRSLDSLGSAPARRMLASRAAAACCTAASPRGAIACRGAASAGAASAVRTLGAVSWVARAASTRAVAPCRTRLAAAALAPTGCGRVGIGSVRLTRLLSTGFVEWTDAEDAALDKLVEANGGYSDELDWGEVAEQLGTGRASDALAQRWDHLARAAYAKAEAEADAKDAEWGSVKNGEWNGPVGPEPTRCVPTLGDEPESRFIVAQSVPTSFELTQCTFVFLRPPADIMTGNRRGVAQISEWCMQRGTCTCTVTTTSVIR